MESIKGDFKCNRCGNCCINPIIALHNISIDNDVQELGRWLQYHGCTSLKINTGKEEVLAIKLPHTCEHLEYIEGVYSCKIYEHRPAICKDHMCKKIKEELILNLINFT